MDNLEDAVALFSPRGEVIFSNAAMNALHTRLDRHDCPAAHPVRQIVERTLAGRKSQGPVSLSLPAKDAGVRPADGDAPDSADRLVISHADHRRERPVSRRDAGRAQSGVFEPGHSTLNYSRKLAALGRLMAGVAHEVKNPLNAMTIHLELLKQKLSRQLVAAGDGPVATAPSHLAAGPTSPSTSTSSARKSGASTRWSTGS